tara:strand:- start:565 stop:1107 length:543 start_codon:yes stop_codon:yes gene_type:complete
MQLNDEKIYISLDLESPILNAKLPNNTYWYILNKQERESDPFFWQSCINKTWRFLSVFNKQVPWNESLDINDIFEFINNGNDINILFQEDTLIGWAWQNKTIADSFLLGKHQIYQSKWLIDKKFLFKKSNKELSLGWIQELKKHYRNEGFTQGVAYIDSWNKGVLKSVLRAGYRIRNWNK